MSEDKRFKAVKEAYWAGTEYKKGEFDNIYMSCENYLDIEPSYEQVKIIYDNLPDDIIGRGIEWGFHDSVVRDDIGEYIEKNAENLKYLLTK